MDAETSRHSDGDDGNAPQKRRTYNPDEHAIRPIHPQGTRLPIPKLSLGVKMTLFIMYWVVLPAVLVGVVFAVLYIRHLDGR